MESETERDLNYESFKERNEEYEKSTRKLLKNILTLAPRDVVIKVLKEMKIISNEYNPKTDKLELMERTTEESSNG